MKLDLLISNIALTLLTYQNSQTTQNLSSQPDFINPLQITPSDKQQSSYPIYLSHKPDEKEPISIFTLAKLSCTISTCRFGDFVALIALIALTRLQGYQSDWRGIQGVSKCLWAFSGLLSLLTRVTSGITNNNRYMFLKATRLSRQQEGWAGIGFSINLLFLMLLLSAMRIDHW